ncbi:MAG: hypothetical protein NZ455_10600 [Bacteroidia bacterium]|nr:hypothetical protein [Bacteroidia bacterium]MDW8346565.1 hypothetical protein [Bacteroidia bacterium]
MREACGGWALAQCVAQRSTEAIAQPIARRPCLHERSEKQARTRPKNSNLILERFLLCVR